LKDEKTISLISIILLMGIVVGFSIATVLGYKYSLLMLRWIIVVSAITLAKYGKRIEAALHEMYFNNWEHLRSLNKWNFIIIRYALIRALVLYSIFVLPMVLKGRASPLVLMVSTTAFLLLCAVLSYFGVNEWKDCEREYTIRQLKVTGEQLRAVQN
jgi:hypothetical protein